MEDVLERFRRLKAGVDESAKGRSDKQHEKGKLTAWERLDILLDEGSFQPIGSFILPLGVEYEPGLELNMFGDGVLTGYGRVNGRDVAVFAEDFTFKGGSMGKSHMDKIVRTLDVAVRTGVPFIGLFDSGGARIQEGVHSLVSIGDLFYRNVIASGWIPQISVIMGPCAGGASYSPALTDFIVMVEGASYMFITGPRVVKSVMNEEVTPEQLGGPRVHKSVSGVAVHVAKDDEEALRWVRRLLSYLPSNSSEQPPIVKTGDPPDRPSELVEKIVPEDPKKPYDIKGVIEDVFDEGTFFEIHEGFARNAVIGFARISGRSVCTVANQPRYLAGVLDINSSDKIARFVDFCDAFNLPIVTFVDTPGYMPGTNQELGGIIRHGAKVIYAYSRAHAPKVTVIVRKAYGGAYIAMASRSLGADVVFALPTTEIAVMGPEGAIEIISRKELAGKAEEERAEAVAKLAKEYREKWANPYVAASRGYVDEIIEFRNIRSKVAGAMETLTGKKLEYVQAPKKHGVPPV